MKETLERLHKLCSEINKKHNSQLIQQEKLDDFIDDIEEDWDPSLEQLKSGIQLLEINLSKIDSSSNTKYTEGILDIFWGLRRLEVLLDDADELLVSLNKKFAYTNGEITLEEPE